MSSEFAFPDIVPSTCGFNIVPDTDMEIGKVTGYESITENTGERWYVDLTFNILRRADAMAIRSHLMRLRGRADTFTSGTSWSEPNRSHAKSSS